ncbi:MAG: PKD domain-containing protein, partial [Bacilli bacterium]
MTMRNTFFPLLAVLLVGLLIIPASVAATDVSYYAYGDSVTRAAGYADLNPDGSDCYIMQMRDLYDPNASADHNIDGGSRTSAWGLANIATHYDNETYYCIMFGLNDDYYEIYAQQRLENLLDMYNYVHTEDTTPIILIQTLMVPDGRAFCEYTYQRENLTQIQEGLRALDIPFIRAYDAVDTIPGNCIIDEADTTYYAPDGVHLNASGQRALADYVWASFQTPSAGFSANKTAALVSTSIQFTSNSTGYPSLYSWTFGDGATSQSESPVHTYVNPGTYSVSLTVTNIGGTDSVEYSNYITVVDGEEISTSVSANVTAGTAPLTVTFTDSSTGYITSWLWNFGDGTTSTEQNPTHTYTVPSTYTVSLNASSPFDYDVDTKTNYIDVAGVYAYYQALTHSSCDRATYQQDFVIHRSAGTAYEETVA